MIKKFFLEYELLSNDLTIKLAYKNKPDIHTASLERDWKITLAETGLNALTGARIKRIENKLCRHHLHNPLLQRTGSKDRIP